MTVRFLGINSLRVSILRQDIVTDLKIARVVSKLYHPQTKLGSVRGSAPAMSQNVTVPGLFDIASVSTAEDTSAKDMAALSSSSKRPLSLVDLPQEILDNIFGHVYADGMTYSEKARYQ